MRRSDVALSIAVALVLVLLVVLAPRVIPGPLIQYVLAPALDLWFVGIAVLVASIVLRRRSTWPQVTRLLGVLGVTWVAFVLGWYVALILVFALLDPIGY